LPVLGEEQPMLALGRLHQKPTAQHVALLKALAPEPVVLEHFARLPVGAQAGDGEGGPPLATLFVAQREVDSVA
jgi:hypothetical protein